MPPKQRRGGNRRRRTPQNNQMDSRISTTIDRFIPVKNVNLTVALKMSTSITSTAGGKITNVFSNLPTSASEWSSCVALFDSYRVRSMQIDFVPGLLLSQATTVTYAGPINVVFDPDSTAALATLASALSHTNLRCMMPYKAWSYKVDNLPRVSSASAFAGSFTVFESGWLDTADPAGTSAIQLYAENYANSQLYGQIMTTYVIDFAVRK